MSDYKKLYQLYQAIQEGNNESWESLTQDKNFSNLLTTNVSPLSKKDYHEASMKLNEGKTLSSKENLKLQFSGSNPVLLACEMGQYDMAKNILEKVPELINKTNSQGDNILHILSKTRVNAEDPSKFFEIFTILTFKNPSLLLQKNHQGLTPIDLFAITNRPHLMQLFAKQLIPFKGIIRDFPNYQTIATFGHIALRNFVIEKFIREIPGTRVSKLSIEKLSSFNLEQLGNHYNFKFDNDEPLKDIFLRIRDKRLSYQSKYPPIISLSMNLKKSSDPKDKLMEVANFKIRQIIESLPNEQKDLLLLQTDKLYDALFSYLSETNATFFDKKQITPIVDGFVKSVEGLAPKYRDNLRASLINNLSQKNEKEVLEFIQKAENGSFRSKVLSRRLKNPVRLTPKQYLSDSDHIESDILVEGKNLLQLNLIAFIHDLDSNSDLSHYFDALLKDISETEIFKSSNIEEKTRLIEKYFSNFFDHIDKLYPDKKMPQEFQEALQAKKEEYIKKLVKTTLSIEHNELLQAYLDLHDPDNLNKPFNQSNLYSLLRQKNQTDLNALLKEFDGSMKEELQKYITASKNAQQSDKSAFQISLSNAMFNTHTAIQHLTKNFTSESSHFKAKEISIKQLNKLVFELNEKIQAHGTLPKAFKETFELFKKHVFQLSPENLRSDEYDMLKTIIQDISNLERQLQRLIILGNKTSLSNLIENLTSSTSTNLLVATFQNLNFLNLVTQQLQAELHKAKSPYLEGILEKLSSLNEPILKDLKDNLRAYQSNPNPTNDDYTKCIESFDATLKNISASNKNLSFMTKLKQFIFSLFGSFKTIENPLQLILKEQKEVLINLGPKP